MDGIIWSWAEEVNQKEMNDEKYSLRKDSIEKDDIIDPN